MPNKRKRRSNPVRKLKFQTHPLKMAERKMKKEEKRLKWKKYWSSCKEYLERQAKKGYQKINNKWIRMIKNDNK